MKHARNHYIVNPAPRLSTPQVAALYGCTLSQARRIAGRIAGSPVQAVDPATGKLTNYYLAAPIQAHAAATAAARSTTGIPAGYCTAAQLASHGISWAAIRRAMHRMPVRTIAGYSPRRRPRTYFHIGDLKLAAAHGHLPQF